MIVVKAITVTCHLKTLVGLFLPKMKKNTALRQKVTFGMAHIQKQGQRSLVFVEENE